MATNDEKVREEIIERMKSEFDKRWINNIFEEKIEELRKFKEERTKII